jgi:hypothetical protein
MRTTIAAAAIAASLLMPGIDARAQLFNRKPTTPPVDPNTNQASMNAAPNQIPSGVLLNNSEVPPPSLPGEVKPVIPLPTGALEPYLLTREHGPFMVMAYSFRGPDAPRQAMALVIELREKYKLPAYILLTKKFPGRSMIRGVPPNTPPFVTKDDLGDPEIRRTLDEAAVMVGNEKTTKDAFDLKNKIKHLHPVCIDGAPQMWHIRTGKGLSRALVTTNPFVPAEDIFARQPDVMLINMNDGPHNIRRCPGRFTLQVANFTGRSTMNVQNDPRFKGLMADRSPLATAHDDAERLAEALTKDRDIQRLGCQAYVYHDHYSSRVTMGSFNDPNDPAASQLQKRLLELAVPLNNRRVTDVMIVPASQLLDLQPIKPKLTPTQVATQSTKQKIADALTSER